MSIRDEIMSQIVAVRRQRLKPVAIDIGYLAAAQLHEQIKNERQKYADMGLAVDDAAITIIGAKFCNLPLQLSQHIAPGEVKVIFNGWGFGVGDIVTINTDTAFDSEGVPVSIRKGARGRVVEIDERLAQIVIHWEKDGPEVLGVPLERIR